jgi:hypothetical protein
MDSASSPKVKKMVFLPYTLSRYKKTVATISRARGNIFMGEMGADLPVLSDI